MIAHAAELPLLYFPRDYPRNRYFDYDTNPCLMAMLAIWRGGGNVIIHNRRLKSHKSLEICENCDRLVVG